MVQMESDHWRVVKEALSRDCPTHEKAAASLAILGEQMERLRASHPALAALDFSPHVKELSRRAGAMPVA